VLLLEGPLHGQLDTPVSRTTSMITSAPARTGYLPGSKLVIKPFVAV
jgi:hypothetical protein